MNIVGYFYLNRRSVYYFIIIIDVLKLICYNFDIEFRLNYYRRNII